MSIESIKARLEACNQVVYETWGQDGIGAGYDIELLLAVAEAASKVCVPKFNDTAKRADWDALFAAIDELESQP